MNLIGTNSNDSLTGSVNDDTLFGLLGNDFLDGRNGADLYQFRRGDGQDILSDSGTDTSVDQLVFSGPGLTAARARVTRLGTSPDLKISFTGNATDGIVLENQVSTNFSGNRGIERVKFSDGGAWTEAGLRHAYLTLGASTNDTLEGTATANRLVGGVGSDFLDGRNGADLYQFRRGDGQDILSDSGTDSALDELVFSGAGLTSANALVQNLRTSAGNLTNDLMISFGSGVTDSVVLRNQISTSFSGNRGVERFTFSNGVSWTETQLRNAVVS